MPPSKDSYCPPPPLPPLMDNTSTGSPKDTTSPVRALVTSVTSSTSGSHPQVVIIDINTSVTIPDFTRFYHTDPASFEPIYYALADGSLVTPPLLSDLRTADISLVILAFLLTVFARNMWISATFLWGGTVRKKGLLYTVFVSQLLAPVALIPLLVAQFQRFTNCEAIMLVAVASAGISISLLVTGILGIKAYRCLDNSRLVLAVLLVLRIAGLAFLVLDLALMQSFRSLSGRCYRTTEGFSSAFIILLLVESFFVCLCFLYAVWKSHGSVAARGRIAISLSLDDVVDPPLEDRTQSIETSHSRRGWWDYVPAADPSSHRSRRTESGGSHDTSARGGFRGFRSGDRVCDPESSVPSMPPIPPLSLDCNTPPRTSTVRMSTASQTLSNPHRESALIIPQRCSSPAFSSMSRMSRYMPRVALFKEVMRDELLYTTFITAFTVVSVVLTVVGVHGNGAFGSISWIAFDWAFISCLVMHSFGRVIRRHKYEALLQQPNTWHHKLYTDRHSAELLGEGRARTTRSSVGRSSQARTRRSALTTRRLNTGSLCDSSARQLFPSSVSCNSRGTDNRSMTPSSLSPMHIFEPFGVHIILPTDLELSPGVDHLTASDCDSPSSHECEAPKNTGRNVFGQMYDISNSLPSTPLA